MRIVLGLLIAVNLLMFFWISQSENHTNGLAAEKATNMPSLQLLSEKSSTQARTVAEEEAITTEKADVKSTTLVKKTAPKNELVTVTTEKTEVKPSSVPATTASENELVTLVTENKEIKQAVTESGADTTKPLVINKKDLPRAAFLEVDCYSLGPFSAESSLNSVISMLDDRGVKTVTRFETRRELSGFWVYIPPLPSRADARKVVAVLKDRGVKDYLIVSNGVKKHAISLGFFRTREGAQQHRAHMQTLGLAPVMDESYKDSNGFWLDFTSSSKPALPNAFVEDLQGQYDGISMKKRQCAK